MFPYMSLLQEDVQSPLLYNFLSSNGLYLDIQPDSLRWGVRVGLGNHYMVVRIFRDLLVILPEDLPSNVNQCNVFIFLTF